jgi:iron complex transport system ATP-binding protein
MTVLRTHHLTIGYTSGRTSPAVIARDINLSLHAGELVCLLGPNGAGKSTLLRTVAGMQPALAGSVSICGDHIRRLSAKNRAKRLSVVLTERPNAGLLSGYALVALGRHPYTNWTGRLSRYDEAVVRWAVDAVGARELADRPIIELSDGQQQKFMIARALAQESELILLDEPTAFLDLPRRAEMMRLLKHLASDTGRAILLTTHDLDLALRSADTLWLMSDGQIEVGTPEDLVLSGRFEAAFQSEGVAFDRETGAFRVERTHGQAVTVIGEGIPQRWTRHALRRTGYTLKPPSDTGAMVPRITISGTESDPIWQLDCDNQQTIHHSIRALLMALQNTSNTE